MIPEKCIPIISVVIPIYNCEKYVINAIESVLKQSLQEIEIICIDDGSSDSSLSIVSKYAEKETRIKVVHQNNSGVSVTRNKGISLAKGEFICFLDADDMWVPNFLTDAKIEKWRNKQFDVISYKEVNANENMTAFSIPISREQKEITGGANSIWCVSSHMGACFYKREMLIDYRIRFQKQLKYGEDGLFRLCCMYFANKICIEDKVMYIYRQNQTSVMHQRNQSAIEYYMPIVEGYVKLEDFCNAFKLTEKGIVNVAKSAIGVYYLDMAKEHFEEFGSIKKLQKILRNNNNYETFCSLSKEDISERYWKEFQFLKNNIIGFKIKYSLRGVTVKILRGCLRIPGVRKVRERKLYPDKHLLQGEKL